MERLPYYDATILASEAGLWGDQYFIFSHLMTGEAVKVKIADPGPGQDCTTFTITPVWRFGLWFYEVTRPPAERPLLSQALTIDQLIDWSKKLMVVP